MELMNHMLLEEHPNVVRAFIAVRYNETQAPLYLNNKRLDIYNYLVMPYFDKGTLLDLL